MSLLSELRNAIKNGKCPPIFKPADLEKADIKDEGRNLSNYDKKNDGTDHENALVSRKIGNEVYSGPRKLDSRISKAYKTS